MRKALRGTISWMIVNCIVLSISLSSMAASNGTKFVYEKNYPNIKQFTKQDIQKIQKERELVYEVSEGRKTVGVLAPNHATVQEQSSNILPQWGTGTNDGSTAADGTHQYLNARALQILTNDKGEYVTKYFYAPYSIDGATTIIANAPWPDINENDPLLSINTYMGHFYDPSTKLNWKGWITPTARQRFENHYYQALNNYWKNRTLSLQELGRALHYFADLNAPHHAANVIATDVPFTHSRFEGFVDSHKTNYAVINSSKYSEIPLSKSVTGNLVNASYAGHICARYAKYMNRYANTAYIGYGSSSNPIDVPNWDYAAINQMSNAQQYMAAVLYQFLKAVGEKV